MGYKTITAALLFGLLLPAGGCAPELIGKCYTNDECVDGHLCNKENRCVEVEQEKLEILTESLDDAILAKEYAFTLSGRGGLEPCTWSIVAGPSWLSVEGNTGKLIGTPTDYQKDAAIVELKVTDNTIETGQAATTKLSIRVLYCSQAEGQGACSGVGACGEDSECGCPDAYAGNQCESCADTYERNTQQECVRYEYQCSGGECGADVMVKECLDDACEGVEWVVDEDCSTNEICISDEHMVRCNNCGIFDCENGQCSDVPPPDCNPVSFNDASLEAKVREVIDKAVGDVFFEDVASLTKLDASNQGITDIKGIQCMINLTELSLDDNQINNIDALEGLTNLTELWMNFCKISNIDALKGLTNLTTLGLSGNKISNIYALEHLRKLKVLGLGMNEISNIGVLENHEELVQLFINYNQISNITSLVNNFGIDSGDKVNIQDNYQIDCNNQASNIKILRDRGVNLFTDCP